MLVQHFLFIKKVHFNNSSYYQERMSIALLIFKINMYIINQIQLINILTYHLLDHRMKVKFNSYKCKQSDQNLLDWIYIKPCTIVSQIYNLRKTLLQIIHKLTYKYA